MKRISVKFYMLHGTFTNRSCYVDEQGHDGLLLVRNVNTFFTNVTNLVQAIQELVGKYIMEQCDVYFFHNLYLNTTYFTNSMP